MWHADEYLFASAKQEAGMQDGNCSIQAVGYAQNEAHGNALTEFHADYRVVLDSQFWVKIVNWRAKPRTSCDGLVSMPRSEAMPGIASLRAFNLLPKEHIDGRVTAHADGESVGSLE
ncbi:hypothetical protein ACU635_27530 [[Actinomadura] parvosata]|uniref:hypothetical protein n=1 Tax=[Actinomadura] parvosata TaxID=1955412 RepID=UPI00406C36A3